MGFKKLYGYDRWPDTMPDVAIGLLIGKKWKEFRDKGFPTVDGGYDKFEFKNPWVPLLDAARSLLTPEYFKISEWTEQHFHDFVMHDKLITWGCASSSKSLLPDEPVYFPDHIGRVKDVRPGDYILSATGKPTRVRLVTVKHGRPLYRVTFSDGAEVVCCDEHLWTVRYWGRTKWAGPRASRKAVYGWVTRTKSAAELAQWRPGQLSRRRTSIPTTAPVDFRKVDVPIDPYVLGCLLGDGSIGRTILLTSAEPDAELRNEFSSRLASGYFLKRVGSSATTYMLVKKPNDKSRNQYVTALRDLGLRTCNALTKFVPEIYKVNSVDVRRAILAGLLDTDGSVDKSGHVSFTSTSRKLADDVKYLFESLGAIATVSRYPSFYKSGDRVIRCNDAYTVFARGFTYEEASRWFKLSRKRSRLKPHHRSEGRRGVISVTPITDRDAYSNETRCLMLDDYDVCGNPVNGLFPVGNFVVTHNSNDTALLLLLDWMVDPFDTVTLLGSTTKQDLKSRSWEAVVRYHNALTVCNRGKILIPGKISKQGQALVNLEDDDIATSAGEKAGIQGRALNEDGRLQGAHAKYVRLVVDELAEISNHDAIKVAMANLRVGTKSFKFIGLANPESWENPSCQYCMPPDGPASVNADTGAWISTFGCLVRHHDGLKSPCIQHPELRDEFPFLLSQDEVDATLAEAGGNPDAPQFWKMIRGFPVPSGAGAPVVLDARIAEQQHACDPSPFDSATYITTAAGIDPAWTEGGDGAYRARCFIRFDTFGRPYLDFTDGLQRLQIYASDQRPPVQQMRDQVINLMRAPYEAPFRYTAIDASANQGLADDLMIYAGADCLGVNNAVRASETPIRSGDNRPAKETIYDRGTEAWCVLAEFIKAGQVRGLPLEALRALTSRRFSMKKDKSGRPVTLNFPLRLEDKGEFKKRFKHSPDECDACALAALAVKERYGLLPFGYITPVQPTSVVSNVPSGPTVSLPDGDDFGSSFDGSEDLGGNPLDF